jgi:hypothetical protein
MDSIDKSLNSLMQQIESIDGKQGGSFVPSMMGGMKYGSSENMMVFFRNYFFYWSLFIFLVILILVIKPSNIYHYNPVSRQTTFSWSSFFTTVFACYFLLLSLYWIHVTYCN